jgi:hypothetical protein
MAKFSLTQRREHGDAERVHRASIGGHGAWKPKVGRFQQREFAAWHRQNMLPYIQLTIRLDLLSPGSMDEGRWGTASLTLWRRSSLHRGIIDPEFWPPLAGHGLVNSIGAGRRPMPGYKFLAKTNTDSAEFVAKSN